MAVAAASIPFGGLRFLRVAQREHYLPGRVTRFAWRWWSLLPFNAPALVTGLASAIAAAFVPATAIVTAAVALTCPMGLGLRGRTSKIAWTRRLRMLAGVCAVVAAAAVVGGALAHEGPLTAALVALAAPLLIDAALALTRPVESLFARRFVAQAAATLRRVKPRVVAITGSYGKTSTKGYVNHLTKDAFEVVASPASYNNRAGLSRTVNEHVRPDTEVLVAEMGTYGRGEIAEMCRFVPPEIAVITAIGPVHLERFGSLENTLAAKSEITAGAAAIVLATDDELLAGLASRLESEGRHVIRCSGTVVVAAGVSVLAPAPRSLELYVDGEPAGVALIEAEAMPASTSNVACAVAVALALGVPTGAIVKRLPGLPVASNRLQVHESAAGFRIIDDTYNANPAGSRVALERLSAAGGASRRRVVVTPGMVELGRRQYPENEALGERCSSVATDVIVVGRTNRGALVAGLNGPRVVLVEDREAAVNWIRHNLEPGDVVLYENDLPDHFP
jgi:UDP-N-acetylmuramoyl-tripeptide--D-alanyl-D-alanine ligase